MLLCLCQFGKCGRRRIVFLEKVLLLVPCFVGGVSMGVAALYWC